MTVLVYISVQEVSELKELAQDPDGEEELVRLAAEELQTALAEKARLQQEIMLQLVPKDEADNRNCILEVRAGMGKCKGCHYLCDSGMKCLRNTG